MPLHPSPNENKGPRKKKKKNGDAEVLSPNPAARLPRSLFFCPYPFKIFIHEGFINILLRNPFVI